MESKCDGLTTQAAEWVEAEANRIQECRISLFMGFCGESKDLVRAQDDLETLPQDQESKCCSSAALGPTSSLSKTVAFRGLVYTLVQKLRGSTS